MLADEAYSFLGVGMIPAVSPQRVEEGRSSLLQFLFQADGAIATITGPGLGAIFVAAVAAIVRVLHSREFEIFLPVRSFFL